MILLGCEENIIFAGGDFAAGIDIHTADGKNVIAVDNSALNIAYTAVAVQEVLPATAMVGAQALFELGVELQFSKFIHLLEDASVATDFLKDWIEIARDNLSPAQERIGVFITEKRKTIANIFMRRKII